ncbi:MAG: aconitase X [Nitrososphaeria archaeon]
MTYSKEVAERIFKALSKFYDQSERIPISSAHLSGVSYENIGEEGLYFINEILKEGKVAVYTTVNPMGADIYDNIFGINDKFLKRQREIMDAFLRLGVTDSFTCAPFDYFQIPIKNSHVAWAESSAAVYANSFLGIFTNKESALSALASAILGETINSGLHSQINRRTVMKFDLKDVRNEVEAGIYAYYISKLVDRPFSVKMRNEMDSIMKKSFCGALGAVGNVSYFKTKAYLTNEYSIKKEDIKKEFNELCTANSGEIIILGCPHWNHNEIENFVRKMGQRNLRKDCLIACNKRAQNELITRFGKETLNKRRIFLFKNACPIFSPLLKEKGIKSIITDSVKAAHYYRLRNIRVNLKPIQKIIKEETE